MARQIRSMDGSTLAAQAVAGDRRAVARLLSLVENGDPEGKVALAGLFPRTGRAHIIGFTGSTGAGKSTLLNCVAREVRSRGVSLAVVAVDPSSPFSGGALLGDRLRMRDLVEDPGVFIRSMASRGHPGGVAEATRDVVMLFDALDVPVVLVETVGAGQAQVDVARIAHTVVLVEAPGMGDEIQVLKAGLTEIADIIVVNKADRPEAKRTLQALRSVHTRGKPGAGHHGASVDQTPTAPDEAWTVPILQTTALDGEGVPALVDAIEAHRDYLQAGERWQALHRRHARAELEVWLQRLLRALVDEHIDAGAFEEALSSVVRRDRDPASAAQELLVKLIRSLASQS
ncbi:MAG: methylmalonyl Co-A mutase-associated GTPase MeaB [Anaerolineae bacterium]|nr:methylmalonyl Co-A mutase-associated GTPase MeaB [Anaerolineae bacterium]